MVLFDVVIPEEYSIMLMLAYMENTNVGKAEPCDCFVSNLTNLC